MAEQKPSVVEFDSVSVRYGDFVALERIHLSIGRGEIVSVVGPNGGGKTTLLHAVLGFVQPYEGHVRVLGLAPDEVQPTGRIGYLPQAMQHDRRFPVSAWDVVAMARYARKSPGKRLDKKDRDAVAQSLETVGMADRASHHFGGLSGGQRQRVLIARALVGDPELLVLDEPSTGLDAVAQDNFYQLLRTLRDSRGLTILMVSHDVGTVSGFVDQIACLNRQLHYHGKADGCLSSEMVSRVFGRNMNILVHDQHCQTCEHHP